MAFSFGLSSSAEKPKFPAFSTWSMKKNRDDRFGSKGSWDEQRLKTGMDGLLSSTVFVLDAASEEHYVGVRKDIDSAWDVDLTRPIHFACTPAISHNRYYYSDEPSYLLKGLLQLGADPDVFDTHGFTVCCRIATNPGWASSAEIIIKCRPDLELVPPNQVAKNQLDFALSRAASARHPENTQILEIAEIWRKKMRYGFPSLAQLAHDKDWWAVHNQLCRRKVVSAPETRHKVYKGKTALEWAEAHGQDKLADELVYLLEIETEDDESDHEGSNQQGTHAEVMREVLSKANEDVEELKKKIASLEAENKTLNEGVKKEVDLLKNENVALKKRIEELEEASKVQTAKLAKLRENVTLAVGALQFDQ